MNEQDKPKKMSPLFGPAQTRIKALDKGLQKTLESTIKRWLKKRIELLETLPDDTRAELDEAGLLQTPTPVLPQVGARNGKDRGRFQTHAAPRPPAFRSEITAQQVAAQVFGGGPFHETVDPHAE